ncbi:MAG: hypothetical protein ACI8S6_001999 [Myxococcota bacterium]|jgi:hypothetical protein
MRLSSHQRAALADFIGPEAAAAAGLEDFCVAGDGQGDVCAAVQIHWIDPRQAVLLIAGARRGARRRIDALLVEAAQQARSRGARTLLARPPEAWFDEGLSAALQQAGLRQVGPQQGARPGHGLVGEQEAGAVAGPRQQRRERLGGVFWCARADLEASDAACAAAQREALEHPALPQPHRQAHRPDDKRDGAEPRQLDRWTGDLPAQRAGPRAQSCPGAGPCPRRAAALPPPAPASGTNPLPPSGQPRRGSSR